jgi:hypothetical protein
MKIKRLIISFLLLFTYTLGFAHNFVPHCQDVNYFDISLHQEKGNHHHHEHFDTQNDESEEGYYAHEDHYDLGIYDLVQCLLNEIEHPAEDCKTESYLPSEVNTLIFINNYESIATLSGLFNFCITPSLSLVSPNYTWGIARLYLVPLIENSPNRGPPIISC